MCQRSGPFSVVHASTSAASERFEVRSSGRVARGEVGGEEGVGEARPAMQRRSAAHATGIPRDDVEAAVHLVVERSVVPEEVDARSARATGVGDQRADSCVGVCRREASQRQADHCAGRVGRVYRDVEGAALQSAAAGLPPNRRRHEHGGRHVREEPFDLGDDDIGAVELDVVAGVFDRDEVGGRRQRHPMVLAGVPHLVESRCLDRVETRERVQGRSHDAERQRSEGVDAGDFGEAGDLVQLLRVIGRVGRVGAPADEVGGRVGAVVGHRAHRCGPCRGRGVEQEQPIDLVPVARREGHGLGAAVGVADDHVRPGLADLAEEGVEVASRGGEGLRRRRWVARTGAEPGVGTHPGLAGDGRLNCAPVFAAVIEPGDQDHCWVSFARTMNVQTSAPDLDKFIDHTRLPRIRNRRHRRSHRRRQ